MICLFLSIRLAHASLSRKLSARKERKPIREPPGGPTVGTCLHRLMVGWAVLVDQSSLVRLECVPLLFLFCLPLAVCRSSCLFLLPLLSSARCWSFFVFVSSFSFFCLFLLGVKRDFLVCRLCFLLLFRRSFSAVFRL